MLLKIANLLDVTSDYSFLSFGEAVGASSIRVKNVNAFSASHAIQIGKTGEEVAEIVLIGTATPSGTALTITGTTRFNHPVDLPVYDIKFDKAVFKLSSTGTAGTATAIANGTVNITPDSPYTTFDYSGAVSTDAFRACLYNSITGEVSADSDWITSTGLTFYSQAKIRDRVKRKLFSANYIKEDQTINDWINEWLEQINAAAIKVNQEYGLGTVSVAFGTNGLGTVTATDFVDVTKVVVTYNGTDKYLAGRKVDNTVFPQDTFNETHPYYSWQGDNVFKIRPSANAGTAEITYSSIYSKLENDTDEIPIVMHTYSQSFVDYALAQAYYMDNKPDLGDRFDIKAQATKRDFINQITPRSYTGPQTIEILETISGEDENSFQVR